MRLEQQEVELSIIGIIEDYINSEVLPSTRFDDMGMDSLEFINLLLEVNKSIAMEISLEDFSSMVTVSDLTNHILKVAE
jgi:acyl carrier protein